MDYIIETENLTKQYDTQKSVADLNIHVAKGKIYGLPGRNGAGKTTTMKLLLGLARPTSGEIKIWGTPLHGNEKKLLPRIGSSTPPDEITAWVSNCCLIDFLICICEIIGLVFMVCCDTGIYRNCYTIGEQYFVSSAI